MEFEPPPTHAMTASGRAPGLFEHLRTSLTTDHGLQLAYEVGIGMRTDR